MLCLWITMTAKPQKHFQVHGGKSFHNQVRWYSAKEKSNRTLLHVIIDCEADYTFSSDVLNCNCVPPLQGLLFSVAWGHVEGLSKSGLPTILNFIIINNGRSFPVHNHSWYTTELLLRVGHDNIITVQVQWSLMRSYMWVFSGHIRGINGYWHSWQTCPTYGAKRAVMPEIPCHGDRDPTPLACDNIIGKY